ncbi:MAG: TolB family protein [Anaerolineae bacterium]
MSEFPTCAITHGPLYHWFGYYDMPCWDADGRRVLHLGVNFQDRPPTPEDRALIAMTDLTTGEETPLASTWAFNWQQGSMLYWHPAAPDRVVLYNDRVGNAFRTLALDVDTGQTRDLGPAHSDVGLQGKLALTLNYARVAVTRPGYGYAGPADPWASEAHPAEDGVGVLDLSNGRWRLSVSMQRVYEDLIRLDGLGNAKIWFNHTLLNPSETRYAFLVRWREPDDGGWTTVMYTASPDGNDLRRVPGEGMVSHFDWRDDDHILAWTSIEGHGAHFYLIDAETGAYGVVAPDLLTEDGHCSYSHDGRYILSDTYPDPADQKRKLMVYDTVTDREVLLGRFLAPQPFYGEIRCDLHPRWSRDDRWICFDSVHTGERQVYLMDVSALAR